MKPLPQINPSEATEIVNSLMDKYPDRFTKDFREWLETKTDYYTAPSSKDKHCGYKGGLIVHSYNVYRRLLEINEFYKLEIPEDSMVLMGFFHDLCKVNFYSTEEKWRKDENNKWESYEAYVIDDMFPLDHGHKSVILLRACRLNKAEMLAIAWHLGAWDCAEYSRKATMRKAIETYSEVFALQMADQIATFYDENQE